MSKDREQSAIDAIYDILDKISLLDKRVQVIDDNVKLLSNKVSKLNKNTAAVVSATPASSQPSINQSTQKQQKVDRLVLGNIKTHGYIVNKSKVPIQDVVVNIYDTNSKLVKNSKTNNDGYWEVRLPPGKYGVEYIHKKFKPINRTIELADDIRNYEVR
jgi:hypothetical protein